MDPETERWFDDIYKKLVKSKNIKPTAETKSEKKKVPKAER